MIEHLPEAVLALLAGTTGGTTVVAWQVHLRRRRGRAVVPLEVGQRIAEPDGREWTVVGRSFDVQIGHSPRLSVDLAVAADPS